MATEGPFVAAVSPTSPERRVGRPPRSPPPRSPLRVLRAAEPPTPPASPPVSAGASASCSANSCTTSPTSASFSCTDTRDEAGEEEEEEATGGHESDIDPSASNRADASRQGRLYDKRRLAALRARLTGAPPPRLLSRSGSLGSAPAGPSTSGSAAGDGRQVWFVDERGPSLAAGGSSPSVQSVSLSEIDRAGQIRLSPEVAARYSGFVFDSDGRLRDGGSVRFEDQRPPSEGLPYSPTTAFSSGPDSPSDSRPSTSTQGTLGTVRGWTAGLPILLRSASDQARLPPRRDDHDGLSMSAGPSTSAAHYHASRGPAAHYAYNTTPPVVPAAEATTSDARPSGRTPRDHSSSSRTLDAFLGTGEFASKKSQKKAAKGEEAELAMEQVDGRKRTKVRDFLGIGSSAGRTKSPTAPAEAPLPVPFPPRVPPKVQPMPIDRDSVAFPPPRVSHVDRDEEDNCPVCLEPLAMRMRGEAPHVAPVCGHRLHSSCFEAVYGPVAKAKGKKTGLGLCGVCRGDMQIDDDAEGPGKSGKAGKFAVMAGLPGRDSPVPQLDSHKLRSISRRTLFDQQAAAKSLHDPDEDDALVPTDNDRSTLAPSRGLLRPRSSAETMQTQRAPDGTFRARDASTLPRRSNASTPEQEMAQPKISVVSEHSVLTRSTNPSHRQNVTCLVTVELPTRYPGTQPFDPARVVAVPQTPPPQRPPPAKPQPAPWAAAPGVPGTSVDRSPPLEQRPASPASSGQASTEPRLDESPRAPPGPRHGPLQSVVDDLCARMSDWKGHDPETFGVLQLYDLLSVRKTHHAREFFVYLFQETLLCVDEQTRPAAGVELQGDQKPALRLRGRVYIRHIQQVVETSPSPSDLQLTVEMEQKELEAFVMCFKERASLEVWRYKIEQLVDRKRNARPPAPEVDPGRTSTRRQPRASVMSGSTAATSSEGGYPSSAFTTTSRTTATTTAPPLSVVGEEPVGGDMAEFGMAKLSIQPMAHSREAYQHHAASSSTASSLLSSHRVLTPLDLMLIISVPPASNDGPSPSSLKSRLIRQSLDFVIQTLGPRSRVSVVAYSVGEGRRAQLRKTPFLTVGKEEARVRLRAAVSDSSDPDTIDLGLVGHAEDKVSVVTAVNLALDVILQRKQKNPLTGVLLVNDARDYSSKPQMSLVLARAEAANVPIHTIGWGKSHDPTSMWQLSHHTAGTYTFAPDWYSLKDCMAGCVGGMLSVALTNVHIHISVPERRWFRIRKVTGVHTSILSSDGKDADIDLCELRAGERRELLVEMEMLPIAQASDQPRERTPAVSTATDEFFYKRTGIKPMSLGDGGGGNFYDAEFDDMVDEVPLFEVNAAYRDPAIGRTVPHLPYPVLLTVAVGPPNGSPVRQKSPPAGAPAIVRRRIEVLASDAMTRALLLVGRNNQTQALRLLNETRRIILALMGNYTPSSTQQSNQQRRDLLATNLAYAVLSACADDVGVVHHGLEAGRTFDQLEKNFAAQQAVVLRDQRAWTARTQTEKIFWRADNSIWLAHQSARWTAAASDA